MNRNLVEITQEQARTFVERGLPIMYFFDPECLIVAQSALRQPKKTRTVAKQVSTPADDYSNVPEPLRRYRDITKTNRHRYLLAATSRKALREMVCERPKLKDMLVDLLGEYPQLPRDILTGYLIDACGGNKADLSWSNMSAYINTWINLGILKRVKG